MRKTLRVLVAVLSLSMISDPALAQSAAAPEKVGDGVVLAVDGGFLKLEVVSENIIRVAYAKDRAFLERRSLAAGPRRHDPVKWDLETGAKEATVSTARLRARVDLATGAVSFLDASGKPILAEKAGGRTMTPVEVQGEKTYNVRQVWQANADESLYGLGQHQLGLMDVKGYDIDLWQHNGTVAIPFLTSSRGYGIFWDNPSYTRFGDLRDWAAIPPAELQDANGKAGGLTGTYYTGADFGQMVATRVDADVDHYVEGDVKEANKQVHPDLPAEGDYSVRWEGAIAPKQTGDYLFQTFSNDGVKLWIDGKLVVDHWRQNWLPWIDVARVHLDAGKRYPIKMEWVKDQGGIQAVQLRWKTPSPSADTSLWSQVGDGVDYYFVYGPDMDDVMAGYRRVTGDIPMMPKWAFGLWQSRQRYNTQQESLDVLEGYRSRKIPIDNIVQDWFYWKEDQWGSHEFDPKRFPDPDAWIEAIHDKYHARLLISVWPKYYTGTKNFEAMQSRGFLYQPNLKAGIKDWVGYADTFYDAFNPEARKLFWSQIDNALFKKGIDSWWLDASEPDLLPTPTLDGQRTHVHPTAMGTGSRVLNAYPLVHSEGIYTGQRAEAPNQRVFILTRSAFAGMQRYAAAIWSGNTSATWTAMRKQIPAGLGYSLSGMPYWSMDSGGFSVPARFSRKDPAAEDVEEWREMNARWAEFAAFVPLFRLHGEAPFREPWEFGGESHPAYKSIVAFDKLRYRLLPYVYSLSADVSQHGDTFMRPLVMDFRTDKTAREIGDEYMFGPAFLVSPVTTYKARSRRVYLPSGAEWYDFWTGKMAKSGTVDAAAPYEAIPIFVRGGSIVPFGPEIQYWDEKPADPVTLYVYQGADGAFSLYEDQGTTYDYEHGAFSRIPMMWNEKSKTLTIGKREGSFPGMLAERTFEIVFVSKSTPVGYGSAASPRTVRYTGEAVTVKP